MPLRSRPKPRYNRRRTSAQTPDSHPVPPELALILKQNSVILQQQAALLECLSGLVGLLERLGPPKRTPVQTAAGRTPPPSPEASPTSSQGCPKIFPWWAPNRPQ